MKEFAQIINIANIQILHVTFETILPLQNGSIKDSIKFGIRTMIIFSNLITSLLGAKMLQLTEKRVSVAAARPNLVFSKYPESCE